MHNEGTDIPHADIMVFTTPCKRRVRIVMFSAFSGVLLFVISFAAAATMYIVIAWVYGGPAAIAISAATLVWLLGVYSTWKSAIVILRFRVAVGRSLVTMGSGFLRCNFSYQMVEVISLPHEKREYGVALEGDGYRAMVYLSPTDEDRCVAVLRERCENAMFIDRLKREHLPRAASRPSVTLSAYYRRFRSRAWLGIWTMASLTIAGVAFGRVAFDQLLQQGPQQDLFHLAKMCVGLFWCILGFLWSIRCVWVNWRKMRVVGEKLSVARANENATDRS